MNDFPRQKLCEIIAQYGRSLCHEPQRCEALLRDFCGQHRGEEISLLINALKQGVAAELITTSNSFPLAVLLARLTNRLQQNYITEDAAKWAVESWALALGVIPRAGDQIDTTISAAGNQAILSKQPPAPQPEPPSPVDPAVPPLSQVSPPLSVVSTKQNRKFNVQPQNKSLIVRILLLGLGGLMGIGYWNSHSSHSVPPQTESSPSASPTPIESSPSASPTPIESSPSENAEFFNRRGVEKYDRKDYTGAIADYNQAIQLNPNYADAYFNRGHARYELGDMQAAIADYGTAANLYYQEGKITDYKAASLQVKIIKLQQQLTLSVLHNKGRN